MILKATLNLISPVLQMELCYLSSKCHNDRENRILANVCLSHLSEKQTTFFNRSVLHLCVMNIVFSLISWDHMLSPIWQILESSQQAVLPQKKDQQNVPWKFCALDLQKQTWHIPKNNIWQRGVSLYCFHYNSQTSTAEHKSGEKRQEQRVIFREIQTKCFIVVTSEDSS